MRNRIQFARIAGLAITLVANAAVCQNTTAPVSQPATSSSRASSSIAGTRSQQESSASTFIGGTKPGQSNWEPGKTSFGTSRPSIGTQPGVASPGPRVASGNPLEVRGPQVGTQANKQQSAASLTAISRTRSSRLPMPAQAASASVAKTAKAHLGTGPRQSPNTYGRVAHGTDAHGMKSHTRGRDSSSFGSSTSTTSKRKSAPFTTFDSSNGQFGQTKP